MDTKLTGDAHDIIAGLLDGASTPQADARIHGLRAEIDQFFEAPQSLESLLDELEKSDTEFASKTLATLRAMSPTSLRITFEQLKQGARLSFNQVMEMEYRVVCRVMRGKDFFEGVRAQILDKDRNPQWSPDSLDGVSDEDIAAYFEPLGERELVLG